MCICDQIWQKVHCSHIMWKHRSGTEEAISHWSGKIQALCEALNRVVLVLASQEEKCSDINFSSHLATLSINYLAI